MLIKWVFSIIFDFEFVFNIHVTSINAHFTILPLGAQHGLSLALNIEQYEHTVDANYDAGIKVCAS